MALICPESWGWTVHLNMSRGKWSRLWTSTSCNPSSEYENNCSPLGGLSAPLPTLLESLNANNAVCAITHSISTNITACILYFSPLEMVCETRHQMPHSTLLLIRCDPRTIQKKRSPELKLVRCPSMDSTTNTSWTRYNALAVKKGLHRLKNFTEVALIPRARSLSVPPGYQRVVSVKT